MTSDEFPSVSPARTVVFAIGIEKYAYGEELDLPGAADYAIRFARWAVACGVPADRVWLGCSWLEGPNLPPVPGVHEVLTTRDGLDTSLHELAAVNDADLLLFYWCGHGLLAENRERVLFTSNAQEVNKTCLSVDDILLLFSSSAGTGLGQQVFLVDACANYVREMAFETAIVPSPLVPGRDQRDVGQYVIYSARQGMVAAYDLLNHVAPFSDAVLAWLERPGLELMRLPPDMPTLSAHIAACLESSFTTFQIKPYREEGSWTGGVILNSDTKNSWRLLRLSQSYVSSLGNQLRRVRGSIEPLRQEPTLYVERDLERHLIEVLTDNASISVLVLGDAGTGKSSLMWSLDRRLREQGYLPILLSATWLMSSDGVAPVFTIDAVLAQIGNLAQVGRRPVVLLDTADLLLHSEALILQTNLLAEELVTDLEVPIVMTARPIEADQFAKPGRIYELRNYADSELAGAVQMLMRQYFPKLDVAVGAELVEQARTRDLPVLQVLRSPLLLRMLFDVSGDQLPGLELDVTELYEQFWQRRIVQDLRSTLAHQFGTDLSVLAVRLAIAMLAEARPELSKTTCEAIVIQVEYPQPALQVTADLQLLIDRGVLIRTDSNEIRFMHQTMFEFVAAKGLFQRGAGREARRLADHLMAHPDDLFTGAVLEQLLILLRGVRTSEADVIALTMELLRCAHPNLRMIGALAWLHHTALFTQQSVPIGELSPRALERVLGSLPQISHLDRAVTCGLLRALWATHQATMHRQIIVAFARLARRWPADIEALYRELGVFEDMTSATVITTLVRPEHLLDLMFQVAGADTELIGQQLPILVRCLPSAEGVQMLLMRLARSWVNFSPWMDLDDLDRAVVAAGKRFRSHHRDLGRALGCVKFAAMDGTMTNKGWLDYARPRFALTSKGLPGVALSAELHSIALHCLEQAGVDWGHVQVLVRAAFDVEPTDGPLYLVGSFLIALVSSPGPTQQIVADLLAISLSDGLPAPANANGTAAQRWAVTVRAALLDGDTPSQVVAAVANSDLLSTAPADWNSRERLLPILCPAVVAGVQSAIKVLTSVSTEPAILSGADLNQLISQALSFVDRSEVIADAVMSLALAERRPSLLVALAPHAPGLLVLQRRVHEALELVSNGVGAASDMEQVDSATAWFTLQEIGILRPSVKTIQAALDRCRPPDARASLIRLLPRAVEQEPADAQLAIRVIRDHVTDRLADRAAITVTRPFKRLTETASDVYRQILSIVPSLDGWPTLLELTMRPSETMRPPVQVSRFRDVSRFIDRMRMQGAARTSLFGFAMELATAISGHQFSRKQLKEISTILVASLGQLLIGLDLEDRRSMIRSLEQFPPQLAQRLIVTALRSGGRNDVLAGLSDGVYGEDLRGFALEILRGHRQHGYDPIPWVLSAAK